MQNVEIIRSIKRRSITVHVEPDGKIVVKAPFFTTRGMIDSLLHKHDAWIQKKQQQFQNRAAAQSTHTYFYLGKKYQLALRTAQKSVVELSDKLYVASSNKTLAKKHLTSWYKQQARKIIVERVHHYSQLAGLHFNSVALSSAETRWGSCSSQKNLHFNWKLVMAPLPVIDYVVTHELAHLTQMNHSRDFWETVRKMFPLYREHRTWLKRNGHMLYV